MGIAQPLGQFGVGQQVIADFRVDEHVQIVSDFVEPGDESFDVFCGQKNLKLPDRVGPDGTLVKSAQPEDLGSLQNLGPDVQGGGL